MRGPSIKGTAIESLLADVRRLRDEGRISGEVIEARLEAADLELLAAKILPSSWYPIESYRRCSELLMELEGGGSPDYVVRRGARAAERLFDSGIYQQLSRGDERAREAFAAGEELTERDGKLMVSMSGAIFSFGSWRFAYEPGEVRVYRFEVSDAAPMPDVGVLATRGFLEYTVGRVTGHAIRGDHERPARDHIRFKLQRAENVR